MSYPKIPDFHKISQEIIYYSKYKHEYGANDVDSKLKNLYEILEKGLEELKNLPFDNYYSEIEPSDYEGIIKLRPKGPRILWKEMNNSYNDKLEGALLSRIAGCILGAPVEFHSIEDMKNWAKYNDEVFPPIDYWKSIKSPYNKRYDKSDFIQYTRDGMDQVPVDDDIVYTILNLFLVEQYGFKFSTENVGELWLKYLPYAGTAEEVALNNLKKGCKAREVGEIDNPFMEWIGADIRSDAFAYIAPGQPEKAAKMAYYDAYLSHRRNGIYGEMYFAAAQSAAFAVDSVLEALEIGLTEIPKDCSLAKDIRWAINESAKITNYMEAREAVEKRFNGMEHAHTNNNACLTVFGLMIGQTDITKVIGETVAMGMDNDCTAATAGSIVGAIAGKKNLKSSWYNRFNDIIDTYLIDVGEVKISDVIERFTKLAKESFK